jgi:hypothetical protein
VLAGQKLGIKEVDEDIWLVSFMHYDLGYFDLEQKTLQPLDNPFGTRLSPILGTFRYLCVRAGHGMAETESACSFFRSCSLLIFDVRSRREKCLIGSVPGLFVLARAQRFT